MRNHIVSLLKTRVCFIRITSEEIRIEESIVVGYSFLGNLDTIARGEFLIRGTFERFRYKKGCRYGKDQSIAEKLKNVFLSPIALSR